jgi:cell division septation protein DedD
MPSLDKKFTLPPAPLPPLEPPPTVSSEIDDPMEPVMGEEVPMGTSLSGEELAKEWADNAATSRRSTKIAAVLLVALLGSLATFGFLYQDIIVEEAASLQDYIEGKKPQAQTQPIPSSVPAASVSMSSSNTLPPKSPDIVVSEKEEVLSSNVASSPVPAPVLPPEPAPAAKPPAETVAEKSVSPDDVSWVAKLDADTWVLQHGAFDSLAEAKSFQANSSLFKSAQVLFSQHKGAKSFYIVLTGPYADKAMAETQMRQNPAMAKAWLRTSKSLKAQFQD